jgi:hypothetical protein
MENQETLRPIHLGLWKCSLRPMLLGRLAFTLLYVLIVFWFSVVDVYHRRFFDVGHGRTYLAYNAFRLLFLFYLACMLYCQGHWQLGWIKRRCPAFQLTLPDEFILCFFCGAAVLAILLFALGFLNLYYRSVAAVITIPLVALAYPAVADYAARSWAAFRRTWVIERNPARAPLKWIALGCVTFLAALLLVMKGLPPGGGPDYYTHYFPYFRRVIESHGLWPNDLWYHFYVSKGASLTFLGILVTDLQAPELVTYLFFIASAIALYSIVAKFTNNAAAPLTAVAAYIAGFVYTDMPGNISGWGIFQKHHEFTASLIASVAWALVQFKDNPARRGWTLVTGLLVAHAVLFSPTSLPLVLFMIGVAIISAGLCQRWPLVRSLLAVAFVGPILVAALMFLNYEITGMVECTPYRTCLRLANQERFSKWWSPYLLVLLDEGSAPGAGDIQVVEHTDMTRYAYIKQLLRVELLRCFFPHRVFLAGAIGGITLLWLRGGRVPYELWRIVFILGGTLAGSAFLSQLVTQPISAYRYFSFTVFFGVAIAASAWLLLFRLMPSRRFVWLTSYILPYSVLCWITAHTVWTIPDAELRHCWQFARGSLSLADGYASTRGVFLPAVKIRKITGPNARVYTLNELNYSTAPDTELESFVSFSLHREWHEIMFAPSRRAREVLQAQGLNYFLIDLNALVVDTLQYSPLFCGANIRDNFQVAWKEGDVYLLTWPGSNTTPLPEEFLERYDEAYFTKQYDLRDLYERVKLIYKQNNGQPYPIYRDPALPPVKGWQ